MAGFLPDTSCMVAAVCAWHEHHQAARSELADGCAMTSRCSWRVLRSLRAIAVLTRLPPPHRLSTRGAHRMIETSFVKNGKVVALEGRAYRVLLATMAAEGIAGGRAYDAVIAECTLRERGVALLTFNADDFAPFASRGLEIVVPRR